MACWRLPVDSRAGLLESPARPEARLKTQALFYSRHWPIPVAAVANSKRACVFASLAACLERTDGLPRCLLSLSRAAVAGDLWLASTGWRGHTTRAAAGTASHELPPHRPRDRTPLIPSPPQRPHARTPARSHARTHARTHARIRTQKHARARTHAIVNGSHASARARVRLLDQIGCCDARSIVWRFGRQRCAWCRTRCC